MKKIRRILIDGANPEEIRIALVENDLIQELNYETKEKAQIKGNIYVGIVVRIEAAFQAAFVDYGGNKQGFMPFAEVAPEWYQVSREEYSKLVAVDAKSSDDQDDLAGSGGGADDLNQEDGNFSQVCEVTPLDAEADINKIRYFEDERAERSARFTPRKYKIQRVLSVGQKIVVQVIKEERKNKGATLTTYVSLSGRRCIFMPNTPEPRSKFNRMHNSVHSSYTGTLLDGIECPDGSSILLKNLRDKISAEDVRKDYSNLTEVWSKVVALAEQTNYPALIHDESSILKRALNDLCDDSTSEIIVEGRAVHDDVVERLNREFASHVKKARFHDAPTPIFSYYKIEEQVELLHSNRAELPSGGYIVIDITEALVAIDVNSGRMTRETLDVESTALKTNLEAAREVARQIRVRNVSGLIVIDFIDMREYKHRKLIERELRKSLLQDRARINVGGINSFGLLEMSRQKIGVGFNELNTSVCPKCYGAGHVQSMRAAAELFARSIIKMIGETHHRSFDVMLSNKFMEHIVNHKMGFLFALQAERGAHLSYVITNDLSGGDFLLQPREERGSVSSNGVSYTLSSVSEAAPYSSRMSTAGRSRSAHRKVSNEYKPMLPTLERVDDFFHPRDYSAIPEMAAEFIDAVIEMREVESGVNYI